MLIKISFLLILLIGQSTVPWQETPLKGVDVFGTTQITAEQVQQRFGDDIKGLVRAMAVHDDQRFVDLFSKVTIGSIQPLGNFASVDISPVGSGSV
jgi:hypothetical protein